MLSHYQIYFYFNYNTSLSHALPKWTLVLLHRPKHYKCSCILCKRLRNCMVRELYMYIMTNHLKP